MSKTGMLCVTLVKSPIGARAPHRETVRCLGLKRLNQSRLVPDNPSVRGMLRAVSHLVRYCHFSDCES